MWSICHCTISRDGSSFVFRARWKRLVAKSLHTHTSHDSQAPTHTLRQPRPEDLKVAGTRERHCLILTQIHSEHLVIGNSCWHGNSHMTSQDTAGGALTLIDVMSSRELCHILSGCQVNSATTQSVHVSYPILHVSFRGTLQHHCLIQQLYQEPFLALWNGRMGIETWRMGL